MRIPVFFAAPHRVMFLGGTVQALATMAFWSLEVGGRAQRDFLPGFVLLACGWSLVWAALLQPSLLIAGLVLVGSGWIALALILVRIARHRAGDREHIVVVSLAAWLGAAGLAAFVMTAAGNGPLWASQASGPCIS